MLCKTSIITWAVQAAILVQKCLDKQKISPSYVYNLYYCYFFLI